MKKPRQRRMGVLLLAGWAAVAVTPSGAGPFSVVSDSEQITAVSSKVHNGYVRARLADGSFRPETYALGNGGFVGGNLGALESQSPSFTRDDTIDDISFAAVAGIIESPLAGQKYLPARDPKQTELLIMVFWGLTVGSIHTKNGPDRDRIDARNAVLLGFDSERMFEQGFDDPSNLMAHIVREVHTDVMSAIEVDRYFVVLRAFDFQSAWRQRKIKLLWETRFSLSERRHDFGKELPTMTQFAARYFGQDSHGLVNKPIPEGRVEIGEPRSLGDSPEK